MDYLKKTLGVFVLSGLFLPASFLAQIQQAVGQTGIQNIRDEAQELIAEYRELGEQLESLREEYQQTGSDELRDELNVLIGERMLLLIDIDSKRLEIAQARLNKLSGADVSVDSALVAQIKRDLEGQQREAQRRLNSLASDIEGAIDGKPVELERLKELRDQLIRTHRTLVVNLMRKLRAGAVYVAYEKLHGISEKLKTALDSKDLLDANRGIFEPVDSVLEEVRTSAERAFRSFSSVNYDSDLDDVETLHSEGELELEEATEGVDEAKELIKSLKEQVKSIIDEYREPEPVRPGGGDPPGGSVCDGPIREVGGFRYCGLEPGANECEAGFTERNGVRFCADLDDAVTPRPAGGFTKCVGQGCRDNGQSCLRGYAEALDLSPAGRILVCRDCQDGFTKKQGVCVRVSSTSGATSGTTAGTSGGLRVDTGDPVENEFLERQPSAQGGESPSTVNNPFWECPEGSTPQFTTRNGVITGRTCSSLPTSGTSQQGAQPEPSQPAATQSGGLLDTIRGIGDRLSCGLYQPKCLTPGSNPVCTNGSWTCTCSGTLQPQTQSGIVTGYLCISSAADDADRLLIQRAQEQREAQARAEAEAADRVLIERARQQQEEPARLSCSGSGPICNGGTKRCSSTSGAWWCQCPSGKVPVRTAANAYTCVSSGGGSAPTAL